jgi:predicted DNA-binding protein (MmcQ/YjbR family)
VTRAAGRRTVRSTASAKRRAPRAARAAKPAAVSRASRATAATRAATTRAARRATATRAARSPAATRATPARAARRSGLAAAEARLRAHALGKPEATEHFPWGERAIKVKGKVFAFMYRDAERLSLTTKLPETGAMALLLPFAEPTGDGLGKAGWVSARFAATDRPPLDVLTAWIDESYGAVAPAKLAASARGEASAAPASRRTRRPAG